MIVLDFIGPINSAPAVTHPVGPLGAFLGLGVAIAAVVIAAGLSVSDRW